MADIFPFRAIRYNAPDRNVTRQIAPPYDVLSDADKARLLADGPHNIVAVDLPHTPPKSAGPAEAYTRAADTLRDWIAQDVLTRDPEPAIYAYLQTFQDAGRTHCRRGFIAAVRAEQFRATPAGVYPHEQTFSGPKEDRLALYRAAKTQISPIFGLFADDGNAITDGLYAGLSDQPTLFGRLGPVEHRAWRVTDAAKVAAVVEGMKSRPIFIADGHHRYTTALNYLAEREAAGLPADHPARRVMFVCVSMSDPGLIILPTHRVVTVRAFDHDKLARKLEHAFEVMSAHLSPEGMESHVLGTGPGNFGVVFSGGAGGLLLKLKHETLLDKYEPQRGQAYRRLDVAILHRYILQEVLTPLAGEPAGIEYPHNGGDVSSALSASKLDAATAFGSKDAATQSGSLAKVAFILAPTPLAAVRDVCLSGELMPQKSTFFYPKLATGMTLYDVG